MIILDERRVERAEYEEYSFTVVLDELKRHAARLVRVDVPADIVNEEAALEYGLAAFPSLGTPGYNVPLTRPVVAPLWRLVAFVRDQPRVVLWWHATIAAWVTPPLTHEPVWLQVEDGPQQIAHIKRFGGEWNFDLRTGELTLVEMEEDDKGYGRRASAPAQDRVLFAKTLRYLLSEYAAVTRNNPAHRARRRR